MPAPVAPGYHRAVAAEIDRQKRLGHSIESDDAKGLEHLLSLAFQYVAQGSTVKGGAMIIAARAYLQRHTKNPMQEAIEDFMNRCDQEVRAYPGIPDDKVKLLRARLMVEELLGSKIGGSVFGVPLIINKSDELIQSMFNDDLVGIADGLADVLYVVIGTAVAYGIDIQEIFDEVHRSNLSKTVWNEDLERYTIEKDEFGKGLKPETYSPAELAPIIDRQIENGKTMEAFLQDQANDSELVVSKIEV
jgi:predicted HAD superfamily Cof-like phosphohydrolase